MHPPVLEDVVKGRPPMRKDDVMDATVTAQGNGPGEQLYDRRWLALVFHASAANLAAVAASLVSLTGRHSNPMSSDVTCSPSRTDCRVSATRMDRCRVDDGAVSSPN